MAKVLQPLSVPPVLNVPVLDALKVLRELRARVLPVRRRATSTSTGSTSTGSTSSTWSTAPEVPEAPVGPAAPSRLDA